MKKFKFWCKGTSTNKNFDKPGWWTYPNFMLDKYYSNLDIFESEDFVACQYTGLKDKNSKEIYEGDIISLKVSDENLNKYDMIGEVDFEEFEYVVYTNDDKWPCVSFSVIELNNLEIVGNIFENPELLNTKG